jgi:hypothetical protein
MAGAEINDGVVQDANERGEKLLAEDFLLWIEREHAEEGPGVTEDRFRSYEEALSEQRASFDPGELRSSLDETMVDSEAWVDDDAVYALGGDRISTFPAAWHDRLADSDDLREYVAVIEEATSDTEISTGGRGPGVPEGLLLDAASVIGGLDREVAKERLERLRDDGDLVQDADQHPDARVYLGEEVRDMRDPWLE